MEKFNLFIEQSNFKDEVLNTAKLTKLEVSVIEKKWFFYVSFDAVPSLEGFEEFKEKIGLYFTIKGTVNKIALKVNILDPSNFHEDAMKYFNWAYQKALTVQPSLCIIDNYQVMYSDNTFTIKTDKEGLRLKNNMRGIEAHFESIGLSPSFVFIEDQTIMSGEVKLRQRQAKHLTEIPVLPKRIKSTPIKSGKLKTTNYSRGQKPDKVSPIKDIPHTQYDFDKHINTNGQQVYLIEGIIISSVVQKLKTTTLLTMSVADEDDAIIVKQFLRKDEDVEIAQKYEENHYCQCYGRIQFDSYADDVVLMANQIEIKEKISRRERKDTAKEKRVELHIHTKMSAQDAVTDVKDYVEQAIRWGHKAIAFTDHDGVQAFPDVYKYTVGKDIKPIYGVEVNYFDETTFKMAFEDADIPLKDAIYTVFDLETTGLSSTRDKIIEISAVKVQNMQIIDSFNVFVNPEMTLSTFTKDLTSITDKDLENAETIDKVLPKLIEFMEGTILVAHNAPFDLGFLYENMKKLNMPIQKFPAIDTLAIAKYYYQDQLRLFNLKALARHFKVNLSQHHRAIEDAQATAEIFIKMLYDLMNKDIKTHSDINKSIDLEIAWRCGYPSHITLLTQTQTGYKNLFKLISDTLTDHYHKDPLLTRETLNLYKEGLLIGSSCYKGLVFDAALRKSDEELEAEMALFDYIEVQPKQAYLHLHDEIGDDADFIIESTIRKIVSTAQKLGKIVVATGDVHYLNKEDKFYREIYIRSKMVGGRLHDLAFAKEAPDVHFLTTDEMLKQFAFLGEKLAYEIVVTNTNKIADMIDRVQGLPSSLYTLEDDAFNESLGVASIKEEVNKIVYQNAHLLYGEKLHPIVSNRIDVELSNIINNEFGPIYYISYLLTRTSLNDGYLVGSRGSVGSSLVATLMDITEVNPLKPHYRCKNGDFTVFHLSDEEISKYGITPNEKAFQELFKGVESGYDLPSQTCPNCGEELLRDGQDIPFETFLGFKGDKVPDIDLNFSGEYQSKAHNYVKDLLGEDHAFRSGTISTIKDKKAFGYVMRYLEDNNMMDVRKVQIARYAKQIEGVKVSTGQHPGGIVVVPRDKDIFDVTPIQYPADDTTSEWKTTHFDYHSLENNLLKLDILGHDDPTVIKYLMDYVKEHPEEFPFTRAQDIPLDDKEVYKLFSSTESIGVKEEDLESDIATFGVPELGTPFVRQMVSETKPSTFAGLVKISGLSHGTNVWLNNAQTLVNGSDDSLGKVPFEKIIGCRDDIMIDLINFGMPSELAFEIMEFVRRGKPTKERSKWSLYKTEMEKYNVPAWYIWSCGRIEYMFPKAHACAYVLMAVRIAWFKVHHPKLFYSTFFSIRATAFEHDILAAGKNAIRNRIKELNQIPDFRQTVKERELLTNYLVAYEMLLRDIKFLPVHISKSEADTFAIEKDGLRMPFKTIDGLGNTASQSIITERTKKAFKSIEDVMDRTSINKTVRETLMKIGAFDGLEEQTDIFNKGLFAL